MDFLLLVVALVGGVAALLALARVRAERRWNAAGTVEVTVSATGVRRELADGRVEEVRWGDVAEVDVVLADRGPHAPSGGVIVLYASATTGALVPLDQLGPSGLLEHLARLPGFRIERLVAALDERPPARVTCWGLTDDAS